jgi:hypothetical protein
MNLAQKFCSLCRKCYVLKNRTDKPECSPILINPQTMKVWSRPFSNTKKNVNAFLYFFGGLECVGHSFAYVAQFLFLRDVRELPQQAGALPT